MRVYWQNQGLMLEPEGDDEVRALELLSQNVKSGRDPKPWKQGPFPTTPFFDEPVKIDGHLRGFINETPNAKEE